MIIASKPETFNDIKASVGVFTIGSPDKLKDWYYHAHLIFQLILF